MCELRKRCFVERSSMATCIKPPIPAGTAPTDNTFYTEDELVNGRCPNHPSIVPDWFEEENYFFALSKYSDRLLAHIQAAPRFYCTRQSASRGAGS